MTEIITFDELIEISGDPVILKSRPTKEWWEENRDRVGSLVICDDVDTDSPHFLTLWPGL